MKANKKKIIVLVSMVFLLVATGCLSYFLNTGDTAGETNEGTTEVEPTFFELCRDERTLTRTEMQIELDEIISSTVASEEAIATAIDEKLALTTAMDVELTLETLIKAQGFADALVTVGSENINVVVQDDDLTLQEATQILNIIVTETSYTAENVVIIPYV